MMENQVLTIEQMKELEALDIDITKASMFYCGRDNNSLEVNDGWIEEDDILTFTLQDILEMLPKNIIADCGVFKQVKFSLRIQYSVLEYSTSKLGLHTEIIKEETSSLLQAAFNMLKWIKQNKYI